MPDYNLNTWVSIPVCNYGKDGDDHVITTGIQYIPFMENYKSLTLEPGINTHD